MTETVSINLATATAAFRQHQRAPRPVLVLTHLEQAQLVSLDEPVTVGRDPAADITIADRSLSREHARFERRGDQVVVVDLGSTNGVWVAGRRVETEMVIAADAEVTLGRVLASVRKLDIEPRRRRFLEDHETFLEAVAEEVRRARFFRRQVTLLNLRLVGSPQPLMRQWFAEVQSRLRPIDRVAAYSSDTLTALLPEISIDALAQCFVDMRAALAEVLPTTELLGGAATYPASAASAEELRHRAREALTQAHADDPLLLAQMTPHRSYSASTSSASDLGFVAESEAMKRLVAYARRIAPSPLPVLIVGEPGVGKETVARLIHERSDRASAPMVSVQCRALAPTLQTARLCGHLAGAFDGADTDEPGLLRGASGQTVFLDDVDSLSLGTQVELLRLVEQQALLPLGATRPEPVDVRLLCASSQPLDELVDAGRFSRDLLGRLEVLKLVVPPLRKRPEDIVPLAEGFLRRRSERARSLDPLALQLLEAHDWPGNLRELENTLERAAALGRGPAITADQLPFTQPPPALEDGGVDLRERIEELEIDLLQQALAATNGDQARASAWLRMPLRTFLDKLKTYGLRTPRRRRR